MNELQVGKATHIASLIIRRMQNKLSDNEWTELEAWMQENGENYLLYEELMDQEKLNAALDDLHTINHDIAFERLSQKLSLTTESPKSIQPKILKIWWYMVAALLVLIAGGFFYFNTNTPTGPSKMPPPLVTAQKKLPGTGPDSQKAILILADNTTIALDEVNNGSVARQGNSQVMKKSSGELQYSFTDAAANEKGNKAIQMGYNTIHTPRGGEYQIVLDDGTRIWLNAASTLRFPVHFQGDERRVTLTGEAYFEVASSISPATGHKKTFTVRVNDMDVQALGTAFNINAYKEDKLTQTTVVEGLVKVSAHNKDQLLPPGKKLVAQDSSFTVEDADIKQEIAWKNGQFVFRNTSLEAVMNELARWYDVDVIYKQTMPSLHFSGEIQRQATIDRVLEMLELTGGVNFDIKGKVVQVYRTESL